MNWRRRLRRRELVLVLGGGGAKSFSQVGVLKVLEEEGLFPSRVVGCSMGAILGGLYCQGKKVQEIEEIIRDFSSWKEIREIERKFTRKKKGLPRIGDYLKDVTLYFRELTREGLWEEKDLLEGLGKLFPEEKKIEELPLPFWCVAVDLKEGKRIIFRRGYLLPSIAASSSIPGVFSPVKSGDRILGDGGILSKIPVMGAIENGKEFIISVLPGNLPPASPKRALDFLIRMNELREWELTRLEAGLSDFLIVPEVEEWKWFSFSHAEEIIKKGEETARRIIPLLKRRIHSPSRRLRKERTLFLPYFPYEEDTISHYRSGQGRS